MQVAVDHVSFSIDEGEFVVITGQSGAGKSTVLNLLGGMDRPAQGTIRVQGKDISSMNDKELIYRRDMLCYERDSLGLDDLIQELNEEMPWRAAV